MLYAFSGGENMKRFFILFSVAFLLSLSFPQEGYSFDMSLFRGPKIEDLYLVIIRDPDAQLLALEKDEIQMLTDIARPADIERLSQNASIQMSLAKGFHGFFFGMNLRMFPWNRQELRQAAWEAIPREKIVRDLFSGYAEPLSTFLPPASPYYEKDVIHYFSDPEKAKKRLKDAGWTWNNKGILTDPEEHRELPPMKMLSPTAQVSPTTAEIAERIATSLRAIGIPLEVEPMDFSAMIARLDERKFDTYVLAWQMTRDPDSLFAFYHSSMDVQGGYNISGISHPQLDDVVSRLRWAPDEEAAREAASESQKLLSELVPVIPIYSRYFITAATSSWKGYVTTSYTTADNIWSLFQLEPAQGSMKPLRWVLLDEPRSLNPLDTSSAYDWNVLAFIYDSLLAIDPETLTDLPWVAESWSVDTVKKDKHNVTQLTFHMKKGMLWQDGRPLTSSDAAYTIEYLKNHQLPRYYDSVRDVENIETPDAQTLIVTMNSTSYWHLHNIGGLPLFPRHVLEQVKDWRSWKPSQTWLDKEKKLTQLMGSGPFIFREYRPGEYVHLTKNPLFWLLNNR